MRHGNPDLIFEDELETRVNRVVDLFRDGLPPKPGLERVTLFVTDRCNLACRYCNGPHLPHNAVRSGAPTLAYLDTATFQRWLEDWKDAGLKHLHFTGGEPATHPKIHAFARAAASRGIAVSITSNGTLPYKVYARLLRAGLSELRLSVDSAVPAEIDKVVGRPGAGRRVLGNIRRLLALRRKGKRDFWLVLNSCLDVYDTKELCRRLGSLRRLGPDDIKILVVAQERSRLRGFGNRDTVLKLQRLVAGWGAYPLLQRKLRDMFRRNAAGLRDPLVRAQSRHCFIPLLERTQDESGLYPCSIYKRHYGQALVPSSASFEEQQAAIHRFVQDNDCRTDAICIQHCVSCCKEMNYQANLALAGVLPPGSPLSHSREAAPADFKGALSPERPFLIIKPYGLPHLSRIVRYLASQGAAPLRAQGLWGWSRLSLRLYLHGRLEPDGLALARNEAHAGLDLPDRAYWLQMESGLPPKKLRRLRDDLRLLIPGEEGSFEFEGELHALRTNVAHAPEAEEQGREWELLQTWCQREARVPRG